MKMFLSALLLIAVTASAQQRSDPEAGAIQHRAEELYQHHMTSEFGQQYFSKKFPHMPAADHFVKLLRNGDSWCVFYREGNYYPEMCVGIGFGNGLLTNDVKYRENVMYDTSSTEISDQHRTLIRYLPEIHRRLREDTLINHYPNIGLRVLGITEDYGNITFYIISYDETTKRYCLGNDYQMRYRNGRLHATEAIHESRILPLEYLHQHSEREPKLMCETDLFVMRMNNMLQPGNVFKVVSPYGVSTYHASTSYLYTALSKEGSKQARRKGLARVIINCTITAAALVYTLSKIAGTN